MAIVHPNVLLVEGEEDKRVIPELIEANGIQWKENGQPVVFIKPSGGYETLTGDVIAAELKASGLKRLGIVIDADEHPQFRWESIRNAALSSIPDIPLDLPSDGLIHTTTENIEFGIWSMPDNRFRGMLETFLSCLIKNEDESLWNFAKEVSSTARAKGAPFIETHLDKANIYTWLAWQEPPGRQLHQAITQRILDPTKQEAQPFVRWFKSLYNL